MKFIFFDPVRNNEADMIERIATDVSNELNNYAPSSDFDNLVGMRAHMEKMQPFLLLGSDEVRMIGIWGPSGIGKSTIARVLFNIHSSQFQLSVLMVNIKRRYPSLGCDDYSTKLQLQKEFLSLILNQKNITSHDHLGVAPSRLKDKRVLVVLDDVDQKAQLDAMAKETGWFGPGSRIIITTQDKQLLNEHKIDHIYEVGFPPDDEALEIFCMHAFGQKSPYDGFEMLAWEVIELAGRLPLGLRVIGAYLFRKTKEEWRKELPRLRTNLNGEIGSVLEFSYNALGDEDKGLFLYIACYFNDEWIKKVEEHLANKFPNVSQGLKDLAEKSLISISTNYIEMHDLLACLGRAIVRKQSIVDLGKRLFLVDGRDICQVLNNNTIVTEYVIGMNIKYSEIHNKLNKQYISFERMSSSLQFLRVDDGEGFIPYRPYNVIYLPLQLRFLHWKWFPMTCLPSNFNPEFLVELNMPCSELKKLWEGTHNISNLKWMDLGFSTELKELPDFSKATALQELYLTGCSSLVKLPSSIGKATNLQDLDLSMCESLVEIPSSIGSCTNLKKLDLSKCSSLEKLPSSIGDITKLEDLNLNRCVIIVELPYSIGSCTNLKKLDLSECPRLVELPSSIVNARNLQILNLSNCSSLEKLPSSIGDATNLEELNLSYCSKLVELPSSLGNATNLENLYLAGCFRLVELPCSVGNTTNLKKLNLRDCSSLKELPSPIINANLENSIFTGCSSLVKLPYSIENATNLKEFDFCGRKSLLELPSFIENATEQDLLLHESLNLYNLLSCSGTFSTPEHLNLSRCSSLLELPSSIGNATYLKILNLINCSSLVTLPSSIGDITNLKELLLTKCSSLVELPSSIGKITNLEKLYLCECSSLMELPSSIGDITNLKELWLTKCSSLVELPSSIGKITNLKKLYLGECSSLVELPFSIGNLQKLSMLCLKGCLKLEVLPININMESLDELDLSGCSLLKSFPEISTNIRFLKLKGTAIEEIPSSIGSWSRLDELHIVKERELFK